MLTDDLVPQLNSTGKYFSVPVSGLLDNARLTTTRSIDETRSDFNQ
jgi:hypothetical protein